MTEPKTCTLVGTVKDEGPYLLEWISYHKMIGFNQIVIASNDCTDGTRQMLDYLETVGEITHVENSGCGAGEPADPQNRAYNRIWQMPAVKNSDWVLIADADEFLNVHAGDGTLTALFDALRAIGPESVDVISAAWRVFGNSMIAGFEDHPVIAQFTMAARPGVNRVQRYSAFKTMFRPRVVKQPSIHRPRLAPRFRNGLQPIRWVNGSGAQLPERFLKQGWRFFDDSYGNELVSMNHYMIKSSEAFLMKRYRGTANSADEERIDFSYFETFNANDVVETSIQRHVPDLQSRLIKLKADHPHLARLHENSIAWHRERLDSARADVIENMPEIAAQLGLS